MEKILNYVKNVLNNQRQKYGWKFWFCALFGLLGAIGGFFADDLQWWVAILIFIPMWILGYWMLMLVLWMWKMIFKGTGKAAKVAGKAAVGGAAALVKGGASSGNGEEKTNSGKRVNKVWTMRYIGQGRSDGPEYLQVPSANQFGRPTGNEIKEALMSLGYDSGKASSLANGGGESTWEVVS